MNGSRTKIGFIQLVLLVYFTNIGLCHYVSQDVNLNNTGYVQHHHRSRRDIENDQKICDGLEKAGNVGSLISKIPFIGDIYDAALTVTKMNMNMYSLKTSCDSLPFEEIKKIMSERFDKLDEKVDRNFVEIQLLYTEIHRLFDELSDSLIDSRIQPILSKMKTFVEGFNEYQSEFDDYFNEKNFNEIYYVLQKLKDATQPIGGLLSTQVNNIINQKLAIPEDGDDKARILAFNALYYGVQAYASVLSFCLEKLTLLANYYYENGDFENYNNAIRMMSVAFRNIKTLISTTNQGFFANRAVYSGYDESFTQNNTLIDHFFNIAQLALRKIDIQRRDSDKPLKDSILEKIEAMKKTNNKIAEMLPPTLKENPRLFRITMKTPNKEIGKLRILRSLDKNIKQVFVKYAIQYKRGESYSTISNWTTEYKLSETKFAAIKLPEVSAETTRLVFRQLGSKQPPELVGVIESQTQSEFNDIHRDLYNAASLTGRHRNESEAIISRLIKNGAKVDAIFEKGRSPLHAAVEANNNKALNVLLNQTINIDIQDDFGYTPLHMAAQFGRNNSCKSLIRKGADINIKTYDERLTPLQVAILNKQISTVELLLSQNSFYANLRDENGDTPLHFAVKRVPSLVKTIIADSYVGVNAINNEGLTPLHYAVSNKSRNVTLALLSSKRIKVNVISKSKLSPLHQAAIDDSYDIAELLLSNKGVNVDIEGPEGSRPIHLAAMRGHTNFLELLVMKNASLNVKSSTGWTPLHFAVVTKKNDTVSKLLNFVSRGLDVNSITDEGNTPLHSAVSSQQYKVIEDLIKSGADLEAETKDGHTPLHVAAMHNDMKVINILINNGANKQASTPEGKLFWELAVQKGHLEVVKHTLPANLTKVQIKDLLSICATNGNLEVSKYLVEERNYTPIRFDIYYPLYKSIENNHTKTSIYLMEPFISGKIQAGIYNLGDEFVAAARIGNLEIMKYIEKALPRWENSDSYMKLMNFLAKYKTSGGIERKRTALHEAVYAGNKPITHFLLDCRVDVNIKDDRGKTVIDIAKEKQTKDIYGLLLADKYCKYMNIDEMEAGFINEKCFSYKHKIFTYPINLAVIFDKRDVLNGLIAKGADVNALDDNRDTPLHLALADRKFELAKLIMKKNPDVRIKNNKKQKPIDLARQNHASEDIINGLITIENNLNQKGGIVM